MLVAAVVAAVLPTVPVAAADPPQLRREGRWLVDPQGRVVIVHGLNLVYKHAPYAPPATAAGFRARDARWLARHGFNGARVGTLWAGLTPDAPGEADPTYLGRVAAGHRPARRPADLDAARHAPGPVARDVRRRGRPGLGDEPAGAVRPAAAGRSRRSRIGYWTPEVSTVFDNFWANKDDLLDGWVDAWKVAARALAATSRT